MTEYRSIEPSEWDEALALWCEVFGAKERWIFEGLQASSPRRKWTHTLAAFENGKMVAAVDLFLRRIRGIDGTTEWVGGIGSVATLAEHRGQGHSARLLNDIIPVMRDEGCAWSFLFTGVPRHYERFGWRTMKLPGRRGEIRPYKQSPTNEIRVLGSDSPWPVEQMARLYDSFNATRPLTHVRDERMWSVAAKSRLERPERRCWGAFNGNVMTGYLVATIGESEGALEEIAVDPAAPQAVRDLFGAFVSELDGCGLTRAVSVLPADPILDPAWDAFWERSEAFERPWAMAMPVGTSYGWPRLEELFRDPRAAHYELDSF